MRLVLSLVLSLCLFAQPLLAAAKIESGAASPQALIARMEASYAQGDIVETVACLHPDERAQMALGLTLGAGMMVAFLGMGGELATGMAEGMAEGLGGEELGEKDKKELEASKKELAKKAEGMQSKYDALLKKHGLDEKMKGDGPSFGDDPSAAAKALEGVDTLALVGDLFGLIKELGEDDRLSKGGPLAASGGKLTGLKVTGDRGTVQAGDETLELARHEGRWYFRAPRSGSPSP